MNYRLSTNFTTFLENSNISSIDELPAYVTG
jgi:hypothetical protein